ncbi:glutamyl-tRNA reductase HemA [Psychroflexus torquis ATCC 700755]|uniref:Glutamyl-tRNA reductase n=1 Tax=Psychroflexus torquis (strain ATCC 700755 / CIP 106069 / ACAM 623) TaxID=313595 RepID=K4ICZ5_PSYTT|nr:glutamyl-tRNA reductase [Psychroflexus torquis]AFU68289.1 glutamyl-tRNA reductase HemA [Psychroflexus torquis ATCC 700755]
MQKYNVSKHISFYVIGISYKKADAKTRGKFNLNIDQRKALLHKAKSLGLESIVTSSTCNRTEIYAFANQEKILIDLLCEFSLGDQETFSENGYVLENELAIDHMFKVGSGLDSQILGDFEIISQIKSSFILSKKQGMVNHFMERLVNSVIQASRRIKNETKISSGATSVSFASVQYILDNIGRVSDKKILLFGTGKIGRNTCENLVKHTSNKNITLINRTKDKAEEIAGKFNLIVKDFSELQSEIRSTDILIVATGAQTPTITKELIYPKKELLVLDLSIPKNVAEDVKGMDNVKLLHLDYLSQITDETLSKRKQYIPEAEAIIKEVRFEFDEWLDTRKFAPTIKALKEKFNNFKEEELDYQSKKNLKFDKEQAEIISDRVIHKITRSFASHLRNANGSTEDSIALLKKVFELDSD